MHTRQFYFNIRALLLEIFAINEGKVEKQMILNVKLIQTKEEKLYSVHYEHFYKGDIYRNYTNDTLPKTVKNFIDSALHCNYMFYPDKVISNYFN